jgi:acetylornithine/N-succinyldiaminopimelate aminotransferase
MLEPIQGESGVHPIGDDVLAAAREACDGAGALLVFDEIQTGMGRTGTLWAYEGLAVRPDVMTAAKALGGGLPVAACVIDPEVGEGLTLGEHGSTFAGGAIGARAALEAIEIVSAPELLDAVVKREAELRAALGSHEAVAEIRGRGLMLGLRMATGVDSREVAEVALANGLVVNAPNPETVRLLPALTIRADQLASGMERLSNALDLAAARRS